MVTKFPKRKGWEGKFLYKNNLGGMVETFKIDSLKAGFLKKGLIRADSVASAFTFC